MPRPRWTLHVEAVCWRTLMDVGLALHKVGTPRPLSPAFHRSIPSTLSPNKGKIGLFFYTPKDYRLDNKLHPLIVNFHGGGFTIGKPQDDARWATAVVNEVDAVVVSVDYRLAPENPFPTAIEDGADAMLYLVDHAKEFGIDSNKMGVSGFSAGGNMTFSVPLRLEAELRNRGRKRGELMEKTLTKLSVCVAWYPSTDFTSTREERRGSNVRLDRNLPKFFTNLFDSSYLYPPISIDTRDPYLSPGLAPEDMLRECLPEDILLYTCEWDELHAEGAKFGDRLRGMGKKLHYQMVEGVVHGWDKNPNPFSEHKLANRVYSDACVQLRRIFYGESES